MILRIMLIREFPHRSFGFFDRFHFTNGDCSGKESETTAQKIANWVEASLTWDQGVVCLVEFYHDPVKLTQDRIEISGPLPRRTYPPGLSLLARIVLLCTGIFPLFAIAYKLVYRWNVLHQVTFRETNFRTDSYFHSGSKRVRQYERGEECKEA